MRPLLLNYLAWSFFSRLEAVDAKAPVLADVICVPYQALPRSKLSAYEAAPIQLPTSTTKSARYEIRRHV